jgi:CheY-like chemotaxis protein
MVKILIVDDDAEFARSVADVLEHKGYRTVFASNGKDGIAMAKQEKPDLMLLDVMMTTDNEGFETARQLREDPVTSHLPVIIISGIRRAKNLPFSFEPDDDWLPVRDVLEKPVKPETLLTSVAKALATAVTKETQDNA